MSNSPQTNINSFSSDKFSIVLSNIPTVLDSIHNLPFLYQNYTRSISLPELKIDFVQSHFKGSVINNPITPQNTDLNSFTWTLKLDSNFYNYYNLYEYLQQIRFGKINKSGPLRKYDINVFSVLFLDNQRLPTKTLSFNNCFIESLGSVNLVLGESSDVFYDVTIKYETAFLNDPNT